MWEIVVKELLHLILEKHPQFLDSKGVEGIFVHCICADGGFFFRYQMFGSNLDFHPNI